MWMWGEYVGTGAVIPWSWSYKQVGFLTYVLANEFGSSKRYTLSTTGPLFNPLKFSVRPKDEIKSLEDIFVCLIKNGFRKKTECSGWWCRNQMNGGKWWWWWMKNNRGEGGMGKKRRGRREPQNGGGGRNCGCVGKAGIDIQALRRKGGQCWEVFM